MKILDVGCGTNKYPGAIGIDVDPNSAADIVHDLNSFPYPFYDNQFDKIICHNVLEHINDVPRTMEEIWRIGKNEAIVEIIAPFPSSRWF